MWYCKGRVKQQKVFCILDTIVHGAHWVYGIPKIMLEFVKIQFAETKPELSAWHSFHSIHVQIDVHNVAYLAIIFLN